jgi:hypothetical protein
MAVSTPLPQSSMAANGTVLVQSVNGSCSNDNSANNSTDNSNNNDGSNVNNTSTSTVNNNSGSNNSNESKCL